MACGPATSGTATVLLGMAAPFTAEILAGDVDAIARFSVVARLAPGGPAAGTGRFALAATASSRPLRAPQCDPVIDWAEAACAAAAGFAEVEAAVVPTFLRAAAESDLATALARRGRRLLLVVGHAGAAAAGFFPADSEAVLGSLAALVGQGAEVIALYAHPVPAGCRRAPEPTVAPALREAGRAGLRFREAAFGSAETVAAAARVGPAEAAAMQLQLVEGAAAFRAAVLPGAGAPFDDRLTTRAARLRRRAAEAARSDPSPVAVPPAAGPGPMLALRPDGVLETRFPREGELVALVPTFDPHTGMAGLAMMSPRAADVLGPVRSSAPSPPAQTRPAPRRPSALGALWRAVRRLR